MPSAAALPLFLKLALIVLVLPDANVDGVA